MNKSERPVDWKIQAGVSGDIVGKQMPFLLGFRGEVNVSNLPDGRVVILGSDAVHSEHVAYRYNPETQTAELLSNRTRMQRSGEPVEPLMDKIDFNHYLEPERAFQMLSTLMGVPADQVRTMFPKATNYDQILLSKDYESISIKIYFNFPGKPSSFSCMYSYDTRTGKLEQIYSNDGKGTVWAKWNEKKS